ncbi:alpha/beta hydrolase [Winogradskyella sp. A3E31]|uniref:alpha/beta hydrolase n=1 Tax=Winogradskyella sp. A3E31 TaxID=3349637 RepID=UPI00398A621F
MLSVFYVNQINSQNSVSEQILSFSLNAPQLDTDKTIWVYLPVSYKTSEKSYPVIYMHDAQNLFDAELSYAGEWKVDDYLDTLSENESIIVGVAHGNEKRIDELTPYKHEKYGGGKGEAYLDFIINNVKPYIDNTYRTKTSSASTTIFGSSLGGLMSFYAVIKYPHIFGKAGVFSPAFWINPEIYELVESNNIQPTSKFFFLVGTEEGESMVPDMEKMITLLKSKGLGSDRVQSKVIEGGKHNEALWATHFPEAYQWLMTND